MKKTTLARLIALFILLATAAGAYWAIFVTHDIALDHDQVQAKIEAKLPYNWKNTVTVNKVGLDLGDNHLDLVVDADVHKFSRDYSLTLLTAGQLSYDPAPGSFFFYADDLRIANVKHNGIAIGQKWTDRLHKLEAHIKSDKLKTEEQKVLDEAKAVVHDAVLDAVRDVLKTVPVYTFKSDMKSQIAHMVLVDVQVKNGQIVAHVSFLQLTLVSIGMLFAFGLAIVLLFGVMTTPGAALAVGVLDLFG